MNSYVEKGKQMTFQHHTPRRAFMKPNQTIKDRIMVERYTFIEPVSGGRKATIVDNLKSRSSDCELPYV